MNDTAPEIEERYRAMLLRRSGVERLEMGCAMHATAKALVKAAILAQNPQESSTALRRALFLRFYSADFNTPAKEKILRSLERE